MNETLLKLLYSFYPNNTLGIHASTKHNTSMSIRYKTGFYADDLGGRGWRATHHQDNIIKASESVSELLDWMYDSGVDEEELTAHLKHLAYSTVLWYIKGRENYLSVLGDDAEDIAAEWKRKLTEAADEEISKMTKEGRSASKVLQDILLKGKIPTKLTVVEDS